MCFRNMPQGKTFNYRKKTLAIQIYNNQYYNFYLFLYFKYGNIIP